MKESVLFEPLRLGTMEVPGRVWKTATSETRATPDGFIEKEFIDFYEPMAWAGTPLIITGNLYVEISGKPSYRNAGIDDDDKLPGLRKLVDTVHKHGSLLIAQLNHCGRQMNPKVIGVKEALSASNVREKLLLTKPRPMTRAEIAATTQAFADAAARAKTAGFDGVQIHLAHGYLLNEFMTPHTNRRTDDYGGSFENRLRFPLEVLRATRAKVGPDYPVLAKINGADLLLVSGGLATEELVRMAVALEAEGLNGIEVSCGHYESGFPMIRGKFDGFFTAQADEGLGKFMPAPLRMLVKMIHRPLETAANRVWPTKQGFNLEFARDFKAALKIPVITVGGFQSPQFMVRAIEDGSTDAVSLARAMIADPFYVKHLREGVEGPRCDFCNGCIARSGGSRVDCYNDRIRDQRRGMLAAQGFNG